MKRPDLDPFACVKPACQRFRPPGEGNLVIRNGYGQAHSRLWRCRTCGEEFSERRGPALCHTKMAEATAADVLPPSPKAVASGPRPASSRSPKRPGPGGSASLAVTRSGAMPSRARG
jgi:hypothetical protein